MKLMLEKIHLVGFVKEFIKPTIILVYYYIVVKMAKEQYSKMENN